MERGAIVQDIAALHVVLGRPDPLLGDSRVSVSTQIAALRRLLYGWEGTDKETGDWFRKAAEVGDPPCLRRLQLKENQGNRTPRCRSAQRRHYGFSDHFEGRS